MSKIILEEAKKIKKEIDEYKKHNRCRDYRDLLHFIKKYDFEGPVTLGTGYSAYTQSCAVEIMNIKSRYYLNGSYLVIGIANEGTKKGVYYKGFVLKIEE